MSLLVKSCALRLRLLPKSFTARHVSSINTETQTPVKEAHRNIDGHYDICIVGGGMVGTSLALSLGVNRLLADKSILLLEGAPEFQPATRLNFSNRVSALSKGSVNLLDTLDAWEHIKSVRVKPVRHMQVWDACSDAFINFTNTDNVAFIVENDLLLEAVYNKLKIISNVTVKNNAKIVSVELADAHHSVGTMTLKSGETYSCNLMIGADGVNSLVRKQMDVTNFSMSYDQMGVVATVELKNTIENDTAWQRFLPTGVIALLPLNENTSSLVWSTDIDHAKKLLKMNPIQFVDALNNALFKQYPKNDIVYNLMKSFDNIFSNNSKQSNKRSLLLPPSAASVVEGSIQGFPLGFSHAASYVANGTVLIGDAAHRIHPLAGQGVNLGFGDIKSLTEVLAKSVYDGSRIDDLNYLLTYERERLQHNVPIMLGVHGLQKLYSTDFTPVVMLRSLGLQLTDLIPQVKRELMKRAMA